MSDSVQPAWLVQKERGSAFLMGTIARIALHAGRPAAAGLLYPICAYFIVFSKSARRASAAYLGRVLGRRPSFRDVFAHYLCFASTILDRVFLYAGHVARFRCEWRGLEALRAHVDAGRGCLLVGAHFGSFDVLRALALADGRVRVRVLMHAERAAKMNRILHGLDARFPQQVIPLGRPGTMLEVRAALAAGEIVALLADRSLHGERTVACDFLATPAHFPRGPFELAGMLRAPVVLFSAAYRGPRHYVVRFDALAAAGVDARCRAFASWLEARCREAPANWFNFYDFWSDPAGSAT